MLSPPLARLKALVHQASGHSAAAGRGTCRRRATLAPPGGRRGGRWVTLGSFDVSKDGLLDAVTLRDWAHTAVSDLITHIDEINWLNVCTSCIKAGKVVRG